MNLWIPFFTIVFALLALDFLVFNKKPHEIKMKEAVKWSVMWIAVALLFNVGVWYFLGAEHAGLFLTAYIVEKSLSIDNLFAFLAVFSFFGINSAYHHKVLFYGIIGALATRAIFIFSGLTLINLFHPIIYILGIYLLYIAYKLMFMGEDAGVNPNENIVIKLVRRVIPVTQNYHGTGFFAKENAIWSITPLFVVLLAIESIDISFSFDSIPAVLSITSDPFIVYTSNIFAILGLRALYFVIADIIPMFRYLKYGLSVVIGFIGVKLLVSNYISVSTTTSLLIVVGTLMVSVVVSMIKNNSEKVGVKIED